MSSHCLACSALTNLVYGIQSLLRS